MKIPRYLIVIERTKRNFAAYVPDLPGCVATGRSMEVLMKRINTAIEWHLEAISEDGERLPDATTTSQWFGNRSNVSKDRRVEQRDSVRR